MNNRIVKYYDPVEGELWKNFDERLPYEQEQEEYLVLVFDTDMSKEENVSSIKNFLNEMYNYYCRIGAESAYNESEWRFFEYHYNALLACGFSEEEIENYEDFLFEEQPYLYDIDMVKNDFKYRLVWDEYIKHHTNDEVLLRVYNNNTFDKKRCNFIGENYAYEVVDIQCSPTDYTKLEIIVKVKNKEDNK